MKLLAIPFSRTRIIVSGIALALVFAAVIAYQAERVLAHHVATYARAQRTFADTAFSPGTSGNVARDESNRLLTVVLSSGAGNSERLAAATQGLALVHTLETEIDLIADARDDAEVARAALWRDRFLPVAIPWENKLVALDGLAERQAETIADIRGLSYAANYRAAQIFERIIADQGTLKPDYIRSLNSGLPELEKAFDRRSNLYMELEKIDSDLAHLLAELPGGPPLQTGGGTLE